MSDSQSHPEFDLDRLNLPDDDDDALENLANLNDEVRPTRITPREERYPPIAPDTAPPPDDNTGSAVEAHTATPDTDDESSGFHWLYNSITAIALLGSVAAVAWIALIWQAPQSAWNPLPPPTPFAYVTATPGGAAGSTVETESDGMPTPNAAGQVIIVATETPSMATTASTPFIAQDVIYAPNENDLGCNWASIAGTVTDPQGEPLNGFRINVTGEDFDETVFSGTALTFGAGGYEMPLVGAPQEATYTVQLLSTQGAPLTDEISVTTRADCESNVAIVNFVQVRDI